MSTLDPKTAYMRDVTWACVQLTKGDITKEQWEQECFRAWERLNGPVPKGKRLVAGIADNRVVVGYVEGP